MDRFNNQKQKSKFVAVKVHGTLKDSRIEDNVCINADLLEADRIENSSVNRNKIISSNDSPINNVEFIGRDKTEQYGDKNKAQTKNTENINPKRWFSMNNPVIWLITSLIVIVVTYYFFTK